MVVCNFCLKLGDSNSMMQCGGCLAANYCNKACQLKHWKEHRPICREVRQCKKDMAASNAKRQLRLFTSWLEKVPVVELLAHYYGAARLNDMQNEKMAIVLTVEFDYNKKTFVPPHPPRLVELSMFVRKNPEYAAVEKQRKAIVAVLQYKDIQEVSVSSFQLRSMPNIRCSSWEEAVEKTFPHGVEMLTSSIFASWKPIQRQNVENQLKLVRQSPHYRLFIVNALRIKTLQPRHKTHVVMIHVKLGLGLGQIVELPDFQVLTFQEVKDKEHTEAWQKCCQGWFNLETHPDLLKARKQDQNIVRLPILFYIQSATKLEPIFFRIPNVVGDVVSQSTADTNARECFTELRKISFPTVPSPDLH